ncbi:MAG: alpha/beta hydrolase [Phototrophicaceae bacterium]
MARYAPVGAAHRPPPTFVIRVPNTVLLVLLMLALAACEPMAASLATPQVIIITAVPSPTPPPTVTPTFTPTVSPTPTVAATPTSTPAPCLSVSGQVEAFDTNPSEIAGENLRYRVYLPPCYLESQRRFPVLILLHGASYTEAQWENISTITALEQGMRLGALPPMIVVMPFTGLIGNENSFPPQASYEGVLLDELIPAIDRDFCTLRPREYRAIGGISRGGFWAVSVALRHPDLFGAVGGHSAAFDATNAPPANNPLDLARSAPLLEDASLRIFLDNGAEDFAGLALQTFSSRLTARAIAHTYSIYPTGGHDEDYWRAHIGEYLAFYGQGWQRDTFALPSCLAPSP